MREILERNDLFERLAVLVPHLLAAVALLLVGWLLARVLRVLAMRAARMVEALAARLAGAGVAERMRFGRPAALLGALVFWLVLLVFLTAAAEVLGLQTFTGWLARVLDYLPTLAAGLLIIVAGFVLAGFVAELVAAAAARLAPAQRSALARLAQGATLAMAVLVGADQIGIKITWLAILAALVLGALLGGVTLAVSLGARAYVANLIGAHYLRQAFHAGQRVRVAGFEGRILQVTPTALLLDTADGRVLVPAAVFHDQPITLLPGDG